MKRVISICLVLLAQSAFGAIDHPHHASVFLGATNTHSKTYGTEGLEYEYRFGELFGAGAEAELINSDPGTTVLLALLFVHPIENVKIILGGGQESVSGHSSSLVRGGAAYDFHWDEYTVSPTVAVDSIQGGSTATLAGVSFGVGF